MTSRQVSGGDIYIKKLVEHADPKKIEFDIVLAGGADKLLSKEVSSIKHKNVLDRTTTTSFLYLYMLYLKRAIRSIFGVKKADKKYDIGLSSSPFLYDVLPVAFAKSTKKAVILFHLIPKRKGKNLATKIRFVTARVEQTISLWVIGRWFDIILVGNDALRQQLKLRYPQKTIIVAHAGIDTELIDSYTNGLVKAKEDTAVFVGRLTQQKGVDDLLAVAGTLRQKLPGLTLYVVGEGPDRKRLEKTVKKSGLTNVRLLGFVSDKRKYELIGRSKLFLFPSYEEGWGIALAEALYTNCIGVCYELPHYQSLFADYPIYVKIGNLEEFKNATLAANHSAVRPGQKSFIAQYQDRKVIEDVLARLGAA